MCYATQKAVKRTVHTMGLFYTTLKFSSTCFILKADILFKYEECNLLNNSGKYMYHLLGYQTLGHSPTYFICYFISALRKNRQKYYNI